jgi:hypothetical protein
VFLIYVLGAHALTITCVDVTEQRIRDNSRSKVDETPSQMSIMK